METETIVENLEQQAIKDHVYGLGTGAVIFDEEKRMLLVQRAQTDDFLPGLFELPGGGVEHEEKLLDALKRELFEETGFCADNIVKYVGHFDYNSSKGKVKRQFTFIVRGKFQNGKLRLSEEHSKGVWITKSEIGNYTISHQTKEHIEMAFLNRI